MLNVAGFCRSASDGGKLGRDKVDSTKDAAAKGAQVVETDVTEADKPGCSPACVADASTDDREVPSILSEELHSAFDADSPLPASDAAASVCCRRGRIFILDTLD